MNSIVKFSDYNSDFEKFYIERLYDESYETTFHSHDCFQLVYLKQGTITHKYKDSSSTLLRGDFFIIPPNTEHCITLSEKKSIYYNVSFFKDLILENSQNTQMIQDFFEKSYITDFPLKFSPKYEDIYMFESALGKLRIEYESKEYGSKEIIINCLICMLSIIARMYIAFENDTESEQATKTRRINHFIEYVNTHYDDPLTFDSAVKTCAISKTEFCKLFKENTGMSFNEYLNKTRIERCKTQIRNGVPIMTAAYHCGYSEFSTFYRNFIKYTGLNPGKYKKMCDNEDK